MTNTQLPAAARLTFESVNMRAVSVPLTNPIVSNVGEFTHWPLILIDVHTREGVTAAEQCPCRGQSYGAGGTEQ